MIRRISVQELKRGMFVVDTDRGRPLHPPLYSVEGFVMASSEGDTLQTQGFEVADVDETLFDWSPPAKTEYPQALPTPDMSARPNTRPASYSDELNRAQVLYGQCLKGIQNIHEQIRTSAGSDMSQVGPIFSDVVDSLIRNQFALLTVSKLRNRDAYTYTHCVNVAIYATLLGQRLGVHESGLSELAVAAFFHDIGKLFMPLEVLNFPGRLSSQQFDIMRRHATLGLSYLEDHLHLPRSACLAALDHHERQNGGGYPAAKTGEKISFVGQVVAVADVFDALCSQRPYKEAMHPMEALSTMYKERKRDFAPGFLEAFIEVIGVYPTGCLVQLSNRFTAVVTEQNQTNPLRPKVVLLADNYGAAVLTPKVLDLTVHPTMSIVKPVNSLPCSLDVGQFIRFAY